MSNSIHLFTLAELHEMSQERQGGCRRCGAIRDCCEPDAREYECEVCGSRSVYGADELVLIGEVKDV
jgi:Zn finger protein HypA/HybF involved in hydrogenase expression